MKATTIFILLILHFSNAALSQNVNEKVILINGIATAVTLDQDGNILEKGKELPGYMNEFATFDESKIKGKRVASATEFEMNIDVTELELTQGNIDELDRFSKDLISNKYEGVLILVMDFSNQEKEPVQKLLYDCRKILQQNGIEAGKIFISYNKEELPTNVLKIILRKEPTTTL